MHITLKKPSNYQGTIWILSKHNNLNYETDLHLIKIHILHHHFESVCREFKYKSFFLIGLITGQSCLNHPKPHNGITKYPTWQGAAKCLAHTWQADRLQTNLNWIYVSEKKRRLLLSRKYREVSQSPEPVPQELGISSACVLEFSLRFFPFHLFWGRLCVRTNFTPRFKTEVTKDIIQ